MKMLAAADFAGHLGGVFSRPGVSSVWHSGWRRCGWRFEGGISLVPSGLSGNTARGCPPLRQEAGPVPKITGAERPRRSRAVTKKLGPVGRN